MARLALRQWMQIAFLAQLNRGDIMGDTAGFVNLRAGVVQNTEKL